jgi:hypothetical protein
MTSGTTPLIFISYSHKDRDVIALLRKQLQVIATEGYIDFWDDTRIAAGDDWRPQIETAIENAQIAILLISANFLTSSFIRASEIPPLLQRRAHEGLRIIPVVVDPCPWKTVGWLKEIQAVTHIGDPITGLATRKRYFADLAEEIANHIHNASVSERKTSRSVRELMAVPPYSPGHEFVGRKTELALIDAWAVSMKPALLFEAIGGMGKSMLTWEWVRRYASKVRQDWAGIFWYSFYEAGADMNHFCAHAMAYVAEKDPGQFLGQKAAALICPRTATYCWRSCMCRSGSKDRQPTMHRAHIQQLGVMATLTRTISGWKTAVVFWTKLTSQCRIFHHSIPAGQAR